MRTSWMAGILFLFVFGQIISLTIESQYVGTNLTDTFYALMRPDFAQFTNPLTAIGGFFIFLWEWVQALWAVFWWDYSFLEGTWEILRVFGWALSISMIVSILMAIRGTGST